MSEKNEALRLADALEMSSNHGIRRDAAAELRRLHNLAMELQGKIYALEMARSMEQKTAKLQRKEHDMTTLREAAQQALEALEYAQQGRECPSTTRQAITALKAALAEPVEPVAWMVYTEGGTSAYVTDNPNDLVGAYRALPLYPAPPQRKPLTEEEIIDLWAGVSDPESSDISVIDFARAIERAHEIV